MRSPAISLAIRGVIPVNFVPDVDIKSYTENEYR